MIYTSYISNIKHLPKDAKKVLICRWLPKGIAIDGENYFHFPELSPSSSLLRDLKDSKVSFDRFSFLFKEELAHNLKAVRRLEFLAKTDVDVALLCYEKESAECHRSIIGEEIKALGADVKEFTKGEVA